MKQDDEEDRGARTLLTARRLYAPPREKSTPDRNKLGRKHKAPLREG